MNDKYRMLMNGEEVLVGDEWYSDSHDQWNKIDQESIDTWKSGGGVEYGRRDGIHVRWFKVRRKRL